MIGTRNRLPRYFDMELFKYNFEYDLFYLHNVTSKIISPMPKQRSSDLVNKFKHLRPQRSTTFCKYQVVAICILLSDDFDKK